MDQLWKWFSGEDVWREGWQRESTEWQCGILGDYWQSWLATSRCLCPLPPNRNKAKSLIGINKLILLEPGHTRTAQNRNVCEHSRTSSDTHTTLNRFLRAHTLPHASVDRACPQFMRPKRSAAIIASDAWLLLLFENPWDGTGLATCGFVTFLLCLHVKQNNRLDAARLTARVTLIICSVCSNYRERTLPIVCQCVFYWQLLTM